MSDSQVIKSLARSKAAAKRAVKSLSIQEVERAVANLTAAATLLKEREALRSKQKKATAVKKLKQMMNELGISADDITDTKNGGSSKSKPRQKNATRKKVAPKYHLTVDGESHRWTGRGRTPVVFRHYIESGGSLDDCLLEAQ